MDVHGARRGKGEREAEKAGKTKIEVRVPYSFHYCKLNSSLRFIRKKNHIKTMDNGNFRYVNEHCCVELEYFRGCVARSHARSDVN